jgi:hypothetical protein
MSKSHVTMEQRACVVCGATYDTGNLLLDARLGPDGKLRETFERYTVTGLGMCDDDQAMLDQGYIALIGADLARSTFEPDGTMDPEGAYRTGEVCHVRKSAWQNIFNCEPPPNGMAFVEPRVIEHLKAAAEAAEAQGEEE